MNFQNELNKLTKNIFTNVLTYGLKDVELYMRTMGIIFE